MSQATQSPAITITWPMTPASFGPSRSTSKPNTTRSSAPARTGSATMNPFCTGVSARSAEIWTASAPSSTQTMKLMSK
jgi:hypothetical protein